MELGLQKAYTINPIVDKVRVREQVKVASATKRATIHEVLKERE